MVEEVGRRQFSMGVCLGRGGFGEVYRAKMVSAAGLETDVAVKVLRSDLDPAGQAIQRLRDEGKMLARLNHPTILRVHDLVLLDGCISLVTEYIEGEDLGACFQPPEPMSLRAVLESIGAVASALDAAWTAPGDDGQPMGLVHRDIKPSNIRVSRHGQVKLLDFGIARSDSLQREARTQTNLMVGSPAYMAPERFLDSAICPESDTFALGCCLYEGIVGERFLGDLSFPILSGMAVDPSRYEIHLKKRMKKLPADVPKPVVELLENLLEHDPKQRLPAGKLAHRCEELADQVPGASLARWARQRKWADSDEAAGPLAGRTITEGTMTRSTFVDQRPPEVGTQTRWEALPNSGTGPRPSARKATTESGEPKKGPRIGLAVVGAVVVLGIALIAVIAGVVGVVASGVFDGAEAEAQVVPSPVEQAPVEQPAPVATPEPEPPVEAAAVEPVEPAPPEPVEAAAVETKPAATRTTKPTTRQTATEQPAATTSAPPPAKARPTARVEVEKGGADVSIVLSRDGKQYPAPGSVEAGEYEILESFAGGAPVSRGKVYLAEGDVRTIACSDRMRSCRLK